jgi:hypothetical protein
VIVLPLLLHVAIGNEAFRKYIDNSCDLDQESNFPRDLQRNTFEEKRRADHDITPKDAK